MNATLNIHEVGQPFYDEPVLTRPREIAARVALAFGRRPLEAIVTGHQRVELHWLRPDKNGKLVR